jgi:hypothetical protein
MLLLNGDVDIWAYFDVAQAIESIFGEAFY